MAAHSHAPETKRPLSKSLRRSATSLNRNRAHDPNSNYNSNSNPHPNHHSLLNQALLRASRDQQQNPDLHKPPIDPKSSPFSLHTTPPLTPKSKHLTRSHTFSSSSSDPNLHLLHLFLRILLILTFPIIFLLHQMGPHQPTLLSSPSSDPPLSQLLLTIMT